MSIVQGENEYPRPHLHSIKLKPKIKITQRQKNIITLS